MSNSKSTKDYIYSGKIKKYEAVLLEFFKELGNLKNQSSKMSTINSYLAIRKSLTQKELKELNTNLENQVIAQTNRLLLHSITDDLTGLPNSAKLSQDINRMEWDYLIL